MSLKLSDIKTRNTERFPDFVLDAEDETGQELELHFRSPLVMNDELRAKVSEIFNEKIANKESGEAEILGGYKGVLKIAARDPYHFEVLDNYVETNTEEGDDPAAMWITVFELYAEAVHLGEASASEG